MSKQLKLKIVTPERLVLEEMVDQVSLPTTLGEITILPNHIPLITGLSSGDVVAFVNGEQVPMAVVGGFVEVKTGLPAQTGEGGITEVAVLADFAEHISELSDIAIEKAKARAEELKNLMTNKDHVDFEHFEAELERSLTRVKIADKWRNKKYRK
jgi:F-type H+-transporting ATPase subunit epsilon